LKEKPNYKRINDIFNFSTDILFDSPDFFNNFKFIGEIISDKVRRFIK